MRIFRRLLWQRLGVLAALWLVLSFLPLFSRVTIAIGFGMFAAVGFWVAFVEWSAEKRLEH